MRKVIIVFAFFISIALHAEEDVTKKVDDILAAASIHSPMGSIKALARLGKPAVPILLKRLPAYEHPTIIVSALARIKDPEAVPGLLQYLSGLNLKEKEDTAVIRVIMSALSDIGDRRAETDLLKILQNKEVQIATRLYSATVLAKIASDPIHKQAQEFILNSPEVQKNLSAISPVDLDTAYFEVGTKEAIEKLFKAIKSGLPYEQLFIIDLFAQHPTTQMVEGLLIVAEDSKYYPDVRFRALEILVRQKEVSKERLLKALYSLRNDAPQRGIGKSLVDKQQIDSMIKKINE